jgi:transposase
MIDFFTCYVFCHPIKLIIFSLFGGGEARLKEMTKKFSELTDSQWAAISPFFNLKRTLRHDLRTIMNALLYLLRTGCQWRNLPKNFPSWRAVNYYFEQCKLDGRFELINDKLNQLDRW